MITLLDTEKNEAESIIRYLEKQNYQFIDVWYHDFSSEVAHHIYDNYVLKVSHPESRDLISCFTLLCTKLKRKMLDYYGKRFANLRFC